MVPLPSWSLIGPRKESAFAAFIFFNSANTFCWTGIGTDEWNADKPMRFSLNPQNTS